MTMSNQLINRILGSNRSCLCHKQHCNLRSGYGETRVADRAIESSPSSTNPVMRLSSRVSPFSLVSTHLAGSTLAVVPGCPQGLRIKNSLKVRG